MSLTAISEKTGHKKKHHKKRVSRRESEPNDQIITEEDPSRVLSSHQEKNNVRSPNATNIGGSGNEYNEIK